MKFNKDKYTPPFRVGKKQGKAVLDAKGLEVIFMQDEKQAQLYCDFLNKEIREFHEEDMRVLILDSYHDNFYLVVWEDAHGGSGADLLTLDDTYNKYPWIQRQKMRDDLDNLDINVEVK